MEKEVKKESKEFYKKWWFWVIVAIILLGAFGSSSKTIQPISSNGKGGIYQRVADDAVAQYNIAKAQGDKIQICVQAGFVSAAYLQAQNQSSYNNWKDIQKMDCERAGIPQ